MLIERIDKQSNSGGFIGANQHATESYAGEVNGKSFEVTIDSCASPSWGGKDLGSLDQDDCIEILNAISALSDL